MGYGLDPNDPRDLVVGWKTAESIMERTWYAERITEKTGVDPEVLDKILREIKWL